MILTIAMKNRYNTERRKNNNYMNSKDNTHHHNTDSFS